MLAPVAIFAFNRVSELQNLVNRLCIEPNFSEMTVFVFCDGPRNELDEEKVSEVRKLVQKLSICSDFRYFESPENLGLANSVIKGINKVFEEFDSIIVLEDDLILAPFFFKYMNHYLEFYKYENKVGSIQAYQFPAIINISESVFFDSVINSWGWGTWKNRWQNFNHNADELYIKLKSRNTLIDFDCNQSYPFSQLLLDQAQGKVNSWAIRWYATLYLEGFVSLFPKFSLVKNSGLNGQGTHGEKEWFTQSLYLFEFNLDEPEVSVNDKARNAVIRYRKSVRFQLKLHNFRKKVEINYLIPILKNLKEVWKK